jgi:hypothetical protein
MNHNPLDDIATIRRVSLYLGLAALLLAAGMSFSFGWAMSWKHAALLALLTFAGSIVWPYVGHLKVSGFKTKAYAFSIAGTLFLAVELFSHVGFTNGQRMAEVDTTGWQNAKAETIVNSAKRENSNLEFWRAELAKLEAQNAWATSVKADALRAQLAPMDLAIEQETKRGGCGPKCLKLTREKADIEAKIATAEQREDLTERIAAGERLIDTKEAEAKSTEFKASPVAYQTSFVSQIWTMSLEPGQAEKAGTQIGISFMLALVTTFLAPVMISIAYGPIEFVPGASKVIAKATEKATDANAAMLREMHALMAKLVPAASGAPANPIEEKHYHLTDDEEAKRIRREAGEWLRQRAA